VTQRVAFELGWILKYGRSSLVNTLLQANNYILGRKRSTESKDKDSLPCACTLNRLCDQLMLGCKQMFFCFFKSYLVSLQLVVFRESFIAAFEVANKWFLRLMSQQMPL